jgi:putative Holliday junction resolvase
LQAVIRKSRQEDFDAIAAIVSDQGAALVVVGQPIGLDGSLGPQAQQITRYALALADHVTVPIVFWDERFTTAAAEDIMRQTRTEKKRRRARSSGKLDAIAAAVILQSYLDSGDDGQPERDTGDQP